jgi:hypothetical protein
MMWPAHLLYQSSELFASPVQQHDQLRALRRLHGSQDFSSILAINRDVYTVELNSG